MNGSYPLKGGGKNEQDRRVRLEKSCIGCIIHNDYDSCAKNCFNKASDQRSVGSGASSLIRKGVSAK